MLKGFHNDCANPFRISDTKAMPDFRGQNKKNGKLELDLRSKFCNMVVQFITGKAVPEVGRRLGKTSLKQSKVANKFSLLGTDHALVQGTTWGLSKFIANEPVKALNPDFEQMFFVPAEKLPPALQESLHGRSHRMCVLDKPSGQTRLVVKWSAQRDVLQCFLDQGSIGWVAKGWLYLKEQLRGWFWCDPPHRRHENSKLSFLRAELNFVRNEVAIARGMSQGPWESAGHFCTFKDALDELMENFDCTSELWQLMYTRVAFDACCGKLPPEYGSDEHCAETLAQVPEMEVFKNKGLNTKLGRWYQSENKARPFHLSWSSEAFVLLYVALHEGWYASLQDSPLAIDRMHDAHAISVRKKAATEAEAATSAADAAASASGEGAPAGGAREVGRSNRDVDKDVRKTCKSSTMLALEILGNRGLRSLSIVTCKIIAPIELEHNKAVTELKTMKGVFNWYETMALGKWQRYLVDAIETMRDSDTMFNMGILQYGRRVPECELAHPVAAEVVESAYDFLRNHLALEIEWLMIYSHGIPGRFISLVSFEATNVAAALRFCHEAYAALTIAERSVAEHPWLKDWLGLLLFSRATWPREILTGLAETKFAKVPLDLEHELHESFNGMGGTLDIENTFNAVRKVQKSDNTRKMSRFRTYTTSITSRVLPDADRPVIGMLPEDMVAKEKLELPDFAAKSNTDFSMGGEEKMDDFLNKSDWPKATPAAYLSAPRRLAALVWCDRDYARLNNLRVGMLVVPGCVLAWTFSKPGDIMYWVLTSSCLGVLTWKCRLLEVGKCPLLLV